MEKVSVASTGTLNLTELEMTIEFTIINSSFHQPKSLRVRAQKKNLNVETLNL